MVFWWGCVNVSNYPLGCNAEVVDGPLVDVLDQDHWSECKSMVWLHCSSEVVDGPLVDVNPIAAFSVSLLSPILIRNLLRN